jgi:hypothetical protein
MSERGDRIEALKQELMRHIDRRFGEEFGAQMPFALFIFDGAEMHVTACAEWDSLRRAIAEWTEEDRAPATTFPLRGH